MEIICEMMKLKPENVKDYIELHVNTWPELIISNQRIWYYRRVYLYSR